MINKSLLDLINTREIISFINNIIVETEKEKRYNKVVKKIVKNLQRTIYI